MTTALTWLAALVALPGAAAAIHLTLLTAASLFYREPRPKGEPAPVRFCVLIPAHNEESALGATLDAITRDLRSGDSVCVVADNCTDRTADIAAAHGALVVQLANAKPAGRAAARQAGVDFALGLDWDAMVMIDADSRIEPGFFQACERMLALGPVALQARSEAGLGSGLVAQSYLASFALQGATIPRGRDRLGLSVRLRGTGMVLRRSIVQRFRFRAPASEDLWYSLDLCLEGILPRHIESARLRSENVRSWKASSQQRLRYEAGRMSAAREYLVPLLRRHTLASLEAAWYLATPPFAVAIASLAIAAGLAVLSGSLLRAGLLLGLVGILAFDLAIALVQTRAGVRFLSLRCL